jgi:DNA ligase (NAD+)
MTDAALRARKVEALTEEEAAQELQALAAEIAHHDERYHKLDAPEVSDAEYDALIRRNRAIEARFPELVRGDSPSRRVGAEAAEGFARLRHGVPMLSLDNAFDEADFGEFCARIRRFLKLPEDERLDFVAEPKIDGLSVNLTYEDGASPAARRAATGRWARTSRPTSSPCATCRAASPAPAPPASRSAARSSWRRASSSPSAPRRNAPRPSATSAARAASRSAPPSSSPPTRATRPRAPCASSTRRSPGRALKLFAYAMGEASEQPAETHSAWLERLRSGASA